MTDYEFNLFLTLGAVSVVLLLFLGFVVSDMYTTVEHTHDDVEDLQRRIDQHAAAAQLSRPRTYRTPMFVNDSRDSLEPLPFNVVDYVQSTRR